MTRIALAATGDPLAPGTWSGTPQGVARGLREHGVSEVVGVDATPPWGVRQAAVALAAVWRGSRVDAWYTPGMHALRSRVVARRLGEVDGVVLMGAEFGLPEGTRYVTLSDLTLAQARSTHPVFSRLSAAVVRGWEARQREVYGRAVACCTASHWTAASLRDDYGLPADKVRVVGLGPNHEPAAGAAPSATGRSGGRPFPGSSGASGGGPFPGSSAASGGRPAPGSSAASGGRPAPGSSGGRPFPGSSGASGGRPAPGSAAPSGGRPSPDPSGGRWATPRFLFVGREWERKHGPTVLAAFASLRAEVPEARLDLVGGHPPVRGDGVVAHGELRLDVPEEAARVRDLFAAATCFVLPSAVEPFGIAYIEAAAAGAPSIATRVGGAGTIVADGTGLLVPPADVGALLEAMRTLADPETARRMGEAARARSALFTWERVGARILRALGLPGGEGAEFL